MQTVFYVSPAGNDRHPGTESRPFRTISRARDEVRRLTDDMTEDITVLLRGGVHEIRETVVLDRRDSGTNGHCVVYRACPGEKPVISGGRRIAGWSPDAEGRWQAATHLADFRQLYVNGRRAVRARGELPGLQLTGQGEYRTDLAEMSEWRHAEQVEFCYEVVWCHTRCKVASVRRDGEGALMAMQQPYFEIARRKEGVRVELPGYVENAFELLSEPGEWYLDREGGAAYYIPRPGEDVSRADVIAPGLQTLVLLAGTPDRPVSNIRLAGLTFAYGSWLRPSGCGLVDLQANFVLAPEDDLAAFGIKRLERDGFVTQAHNECIKSPANVVCRAARGIVFEGCTFTRLGGAGIDLERGSRDNLIVGCEFCDIAGSAIQVGDVLEDDHHPEDERLIVRNNRIVNNYVHHVALDYKGGVGVFVGYAADTLVAHNEIAHLPYSGMSIGWGWGEEDAGGGAYYQPFFYDTPTPARGNVIEHNHVHHVMQEMDDGGAIYTLGRQPGTVIRGNHVHEAVGRPGGIYLDEGSAEIEVSGNLVYRVSKALNFNNHAQDRFGSCPVHENLCDVDPAENEQARAIARAAGLGQAYRHMLPERDREQSRQ